MTVATLGGTVVNRWRSRPALPHWLTETFSWLGLGLLGIAVTGLVIVAMAPRLFGLQFVVVKGGSMEPAIGFGSVAVMGPADRQHLHAGDTVMFSRGGQVITHRIAAISEDGTQITTKGDANNTPDEERISPANVRGTFLFAIPQVGKFVHWMGTRQGYMSLILGPGLVIIGLELASIGKELRRARKTRAAAVSESAGS